MAFTFTVDLNVCQDHGQCVYAAPQVFAINDQGSLVVLVDEPDDSLRASVEDAADVCPVQAISISE